MIYCANPLDSPAARMFQLSVGIVGDYMPHPVLSRRLENRKQHTPCMLIAGVSFSVEGLDIMSVCFE